MSWFVRLMMQQMRSGYYKLLVQEIDRALPGQGKALAAEIAAQEKALFDASQKWIVDEPARDNVQLTCMALATYRVLRDRLHERRRPLMIIQTALLEPSRGKMKLMPLMMRFVRDPLKMMAGISESKEVSAYGKAFEFERFTDNKQTHYFLHVKRCGYHDFFVAHGAPELTPIFCAYDDLWGDFFKTDKYGVRFDRPTTIGSGGEVCQFEFRRVEKKSA
jgi:hypothetical protein